LTKVYGITPRNYYVFVSFGVVFQIDRIISYKHNKANSYKIHIKTAIYFGGQVKVKGKVHPITGHEGPEVAEV